ncbi:MAG: flavodoxin family protein [Lachnospiraceae bacterium]|nr:flavodoxin family protein [Lachnospiraceae bacterium]
MKITILNGSPRLNGNTEIMVDEFMKGAKASGHEVDKINLAGKKIAGCLGCQYCFAHGGKCVQNDDMAAVLESLDQADLVVFASPIYWFDITGQLKCAIDRMYARGSVGFHFHKTILLLDSASDGVYDAAIAQYKATGAYLKWEDKGIITIPGMNEKGSMKESPKLKEVYQLACSL